LSKEQRKQYSAEEKIRSMLDGLRGEHSIAELRRLGLVEGVLEAGKWRLAGDTSNCGCSKKALSRMGEATNEIFGFRKTGDHPTVRAIASAGAPDTGETRRLSRHILQMVRALPDRRAFERVKFYAG
jgi:hypothetical protein